MYPHKCIQKLLTFPYSRCFKKFNTNLINYNFLVIFMDFFTNLFFKIINNFIYNSH